MRTVMLAAAALMAYAACDFTQYRAQPGLAAFSEPSGVRLEWQGQAGIPLRLALALENGQPFVRQLALKKGGHWLSVGENLRPEFDVTTGRRRISDQQLRPLRALGVPITAELIEREKWNAFWDAPLVVPGLPGRNPDLPRQTSEIRRAQVRYNIRTCAVRTDGMRLEVSFPGLSLGVFSGALQFTVYRGANLIRQEAIAQTSEPSVAYRYSAGLSGLLTESSRLRWLDTGGREQKYEFGGATNETHVPVRARNRVLYLERPRVSLAVFPPPHKFFWAREIELNLGYVYYRLDDPSHFALGVRGPEREEMYRAYGVSEEVWERRSRQARSFALGNFALYNAPPGTLQRMAVYYLVSPGAMAEARSAVLAYTHGDRYKALPGYQVVISHFHTALNEYVNDAGSLDVQPPWIDAFRALGVNVAMMSDFHGDGHEDDPGQLRLADERTYFEACRRHSDRDFLIIPGEEPDAWLGGHYTMVFPKPVYWTKRRAPGDAFIVQHPQFGRVYHVASAAEELEMLKREGGYIWQAHPRTKGSTGYPDAVRYQEHFFSDRFLGASYQSLPVDLSEARLCEKRCFGVLDDMNNWTGPKYLVAEGDTYAKFPEDEIYPALMVNYVQLPRLPRFDEGWSQLLESMRAGRFFVTSGEVLIPSWQITDQAVSAQVEWTFPLEFLEIVWGDGQSVDRKIVRLTDRPPFGSERFHIPFDAAGKKWVRCAVWDSAGNGAFLQPAHLRK